jgi:HEAT repeat protein
MRRIAKLSGCVLGLILLACAATATAQAQGDDDANVPTRDNSQVLVAQLGSRDPLTRQQTAEELARHADTEQLKLIEGYRLQEKNSRVKAALDWALYRMGKDAALFSLVRALDSPQGDQIAAYLTQLDSPQPLYIFLGHTKRVAQVRLLEIFGEIGDAETLERIKPSLESFEPTIALAAENATEQINKRLAQKPADTQPARPRTVGQSSPATP